MEIILAQSEKPLPFLKAKAYQALTNCFEKYLEEARDMPPKRDRIFYGATVTHSRQSSSGSQQSVSESKLQTSPVPFPPSLSPKDMMSSLTVNPHTLRSTPYSTPTPKETGSFSFPNAYSPIPKKKSCCCNNDSKCNIL